MEYFNDFLNVGEGGVSEEESDVNMTGFEDVQRVVNQCLKASLQKVKKVMKALWKEASLDEVTDEMIKNVNE